MKIGGILVSLGKKGWKKGRKWKDESDYSTSRKTAMERKKEKMQSNNNSDSNNSLFAVGSAQRGSSNPEVIYPPINFYWLFQPEFITPVTGSQPRLINIHRGWVSYIGRILVFSLFSWFKLIDQRKLMKAIQTRGFYRRILTEIPPFGKCGWISQFQNDLTPVFYDVHFFT